MTAIIEGEQALLASLICPFKRSSNSVIGPNFVLLSLICPPRSCGAINLPCVSLSGARAHVWLVVSCCGGVVAVNRYPNWSHLLSLLHRPGAIFRANKFSLVKRKDQFLFICVKDCMPPGFGPVCLTSSPSLSLLEFFSVFNIFVQNIPPAKSCRVFS